MMNEKLFKINDPRKCRKHEKAGDAMSNTLNEKKKRKMLQN